MADHVAESQEWLLYSGMSLDRMRKSDLIRLVHQAVCAGFERPSELHTNAKMAAFIRDCRQSYWDAKHDAQENAPSVRTDLCEITAAECNAFLRSLPPVPPHGSE